MATATLRMVLLGEEAIKSHVAAGLGGSWSLLESTKDCQPSASHPARTQETENRTYEFIGPAVLRLHNGRGDSVVVQDIGMGCLKSSA